MTDKIPSSALSSYKPKRILIVRLDRLGDVVLSTPVLQALREAYPQAYIAMMVRPACKEILEGNPYLDEIVLYDKEGRQKSVLAAVRFALSLRNKHFDAALALHPSNRSHWAVFLAGIPVRVGYDKKQSWLLTHRLAHVKQEGLLHESRYSLNMLHIFGIQPKSPAPYMAVKSDSLKRINEILKGFSVAEHEPLIAIHPSASCVSKRWMPERFAELADRLIKQHRVRVCLIAGKEDAAHSEAVAGAMREKAINLTGLLSISELAALMKRSLLLISNDSGPVHIAAAVGTPVVALFGRNQAGLSPARWGPIGPKHQVVHKEVGCVTCLAHRCDIQFLCLSAISTDEVYACSLKVLQQAAQPA